MATLMLNGLWVGCCVHREMVARYGLLIMLINIVNALEKVQIKIN